MILCLLAILLQLPTSAPALDGWSELPVWEQERNDDWFAVTFQQPVPRDGARAGPGSGEYILRVGNRSKSPPPVVWWSRSTPTPTAGTEADWSIQPQDALRLVFPQQPKHASEVIVFTYFDSDGRLWGAAVLFRGSVADRAIEREWISVDEPLAGGPGHPRPIGGSGTISPGRDGVLAQVAADLPPAQPGTDARAVHWDLVYRDDRLQWLSAGDR
jgi:hypothetical protein